MSSGSLILPQDLRTTASPTFEKVGAGVAPSYAFESQGITLAETAHSILIVSDTVTDMPRFRGVKARGTEATKTVVQASDVVLRLHGFGYDGTSDDSIGVIDILVSAVTSGVVSGRISLGTATTAGTVTYGLTITDAQDVGIGDTTPKARLEIADTRDPVSDLNDGADYFTYLRHNAATTGKSSGLGFSVTTADEECGAAIVHVRTGTNSKGTLNFYTKQVTTSTANPSLVLQLGDAGEESFSPGTKCDGLIRLKTGEVQTTDATVTTVATITLLDENTYMVTARVTGVKTDGTARASYLIACTAYRTAVGVATIQGSVTTLHSAESDATWDATFAVSGSALNVRVTGAAATVIEWAANVEYTNMSN